MPFGLTDPLTAVAYTEMPIEELSAQHAILVTAQREVEHWHRLISARIDLAVASVADLEELRSPPAAATCGTPCIPPTGLRDLLGIPRSENRLRETALLIELRQALADLGSYSATVNALTDEAARVLGHRVGTVRLSDTLPA